MTPAEARARVREACGDELVERLDHLDRSRTHRPASPSRVRAPSHGDALDADVVFAGGGLSLLLAALVARRGLRVTVVDRARVGSAHREWNASRPELEALVRHGLLDTETLEKLVVARYAVGTCRWHGGGEYPVHGVLDHAVDARDLLELARERALAAGATLLDGHEVLGHAANADGVRVLVVDRTTGTESSLRARVMVEARGAARPDHGADLVCPTVGGVLADLEEGDAPDQLLPSRGEILATTEGVEEGRQHLWEAFPGATGTATVYLFYYADWGDVGDGGLVRLYGRFFDKLSRFKRGAARVVRPTFGFIPGWSRLRPGPSAPSDRVVLVGDAAARHSPLTFCGFGAMLRSLSIAPDVILAAAEGRRDGRVAVHDTHLHAGTGALAALLARSTDGDGDGPNRLLDAAFAVLHEMGDERYGALLRDEMTPTDFATFLFRTSRRMPRVYLDVFRSLGTRPTLGWGTSLARAVFNERRAR